MGVLDGLNDAMLTLSADDLAQREAAREAQRRRQEDIGAAQRAANEAQLRTAGALLESRASGRVWKTGLLKHQWDGMRFGYAAKRWLLGDGMGLGKTRTMIGWLDLLAAKRTVIVAQAEIAPQFYDELVKVAPHQRAVLLTKKSPTVRRKLLEVALRHEGIIVVNFELLQNEQLRDDLIGWGADTVIVDEAHNMKSTKSKTYRNVEQLVMADNVPVPPDAPTPILPSERLMRSKSVKNLGLTTGTPILNSPEDLYPLLHLIDPNRFPFKKAFTEAFCEIRYDLGGKLMFLAHGLDALRPMIAGNFIARTREDAGIFLPPQERHIVRVKIDPELYPDQARVVRQIAEQAKIVMQSGDEHTIMHAMSWLMRKRQAVVWPAGIEIKDTDPNSASYGEVILRVGDEVQESAKVDALKEQLAIQHARGARQIVFSQFKTALRALEAQLTEAGYRVARFDGDTPKQLREEIKQDFYQPVGDPRWDVVLVHYRSGGTGLNLTRATVTHFLDEEWNPGRAEQAAARTHRMGQTEETEVFIYRSSGKGAEVDTWMANLNRLKKQIIDDFNEAGEGTDQLDDILATLSDFLIGDAA